MTAAAEYVLHLNLPGQPDITRTITGDDRAQLAAAVHWHARGILGSTRVTAHINQDSLGGTVTSHGAVVGRFTLEPVPDEPATDVNLEGGIKWGYTLHDLDRIARIAIQRRSAYSACDVDERYAVAWHAAVEHLLTADEPPTVRGLTNIAWNAADYETRRTGEYRGHGRSRGDGSRSDGATVKFWAYWESHARITPSPETGIVDRIACNQIWPRLTPAQQQALETLAAVGDYQQAADALGLKYHTFCRYLSTGRARFIELWLEGETPAGRWRDRRRTTPETQLHSISAHIRKRRRSGVAA